MIAETRTFIRMSPFRMWLNSWAITPWSSSRLSFSRVAPGHGHDGVARRQAGGEGIDRRLVVEDVDGRHGRPGSDRHLLDDIEELVLLRVGRVGVDPAAPDALGDRRAARR